LQHGIYGGLNLSTVIALPILIGDTCIGFLDISRSKPGYTYDDAEIQAATLFAQLAALGFTNAQLHERLHQEAIRDPLTGLFNRRFMEETLVKEISRAKRKSAQSPVTIN
jgi:GAF domain-containing protein